MPVARDFARIVEVVEHPKLIGEFVLIGCNFAAIHGQRWIAVTDPKISEHLVVGAILFDDVDYVANRILAAAKDVMCCSRR